MINLLHRPIICQQHVDRASTGQRMKTGGAELEGLERDILPFLSLSVVIIFCCQLRNGRVNFLERSLHQRCNRPIHFRLTPEMLSPRGQRGLEDKILASASASKLWPRPRPWPQPFGLGLNHAAEKTAAKKRLTSLFADYRISHTE